MNSSGKNYVINNNNNNNNEVNQFKFYNPVNVLPLFLPWITVFLFSESCVSDPHWFHANRVPEPSPE
jgi:hypothetical protein